MDYVLELSVAEENKAMRIFVRINTRQQQQEDMTDSNPRYTIYHTTILNDLRL